jgi:V8-like Glu-specific endopeptidase
MTRACPRIGFAALLAVGWMGFAMGCNGRVGSDHETDGVPESALTSAKPTATQRTATAYAEAVVIEPDDAYAETCTGVLVAPRVVVTAAHCVVFVASTSWKVTSRYGAGGAEERAARDGEAMDAAFKSATPADYAQRDLRDVGVLYLDEPFTNVKAATLTPTSFDVAKTTAPTFVAAVGRSVDGIVAGLALSQVTVLGTAGPRATVAYATARVTADGESGGPLFVEGSHELVAIHARPVTDAGREADLWSRLDGDVYTWLTQKVAAHGGWVAPSPR